jgi:transcriptional regulator with XRE-family HTH domain
MKKPEPKRSYPSVQAIDPKEISRIRISMGLSQAKLAERLNINEKTISSAENGKKITEAYAITLARGLGRLPAELFAFPDHKLAGLTSLKDQGSGELANEVLASPGAAPDSLGKQAPGGHLIKSTSVILDSPNRHPPIYSILSRIIFLTGALLIVNWIGERTTLGKSIRLATYDRLQRRLTPKLNDTNLPIVVVDISNLAPSSNGENTPSHTSRSALQEFVAAAAGAAHELLEWTSISLQMKRDTSVLTILISL